MKIKNIYFPLILIGMFSCEGFLDEKPQSSLLIPNKVQDLEQLLDGTTWGINNTPGMLELGTDNLYTPEEGYLGLTLPEQNAYTWQAEIFDFNTSEWNIPYRQILTTNVVLEQAEEIIPMSQEEAVLLDELTGRALWMRSQAFFQLLSAFAAPFEPNSSNDLPGIPLRLSSNVSLFVDRGTVEEDYAQIIGDLETAIPLLPDFAEFKTRPSKHSAYALLARIHLAMENYEAAEMNARRALDLDASLMNYAELDSNQRYPFPLYNSEVIHHLNMLSYRYMTSGLTFVDSTLVAEFAEDDLRKVLFFTPQNDGFNFDGNYTGSRARFSGLANNEMYLIVAECSARKGDLAESMVYLNTLLETRWKPGKFIPFEAENADEALALVLNERRKELLFRGIRWTDLRRLNRDPRFAKVLRRQIGMESFELNPESTRYVLPIPPEEIEASGISQNPR